MEMKKNDKLMIGSFNESDVIVKHLTEKAIMVEYPFITEGASVYLDGSNVVNKTKWIPKRFLNIERKANNYIYCEKLPSWLVNANCLPKEMGI